MNHWSLVVKDNVSFRIGKPLTRYGKVRASCIAFGAYCVYHFDNATFFSWDVHTYVLLLQSGNN